YDRKIVDQPACTVDAGLPVVMKLYRQPITGTLVKYHPYPLFVSGQCVRAPVLRSMPCRY
ncbi:MAG: hypothetical protein QG672_1369, partial [Pseudomonadota bacterium]|nr:hypothetical protein [Pseudomonadota bacterium]